MGNLRLPLVQTESSREEVEEASLLNRADNSPKQRVRAGGETTGYDWTNLSKAVVSRAGNSFTADSTALPRFTAPSLLDAYRFNSRKPQSGFQ